VRSLSGRTRVGCDIAYLFLRSILLYMIFMNTCNNYLAGIISKILFEFVSDFFIIDLKAPAHDRFTRKRRGGHLC